jgi:thiamine-phosphate pyrophosphorylase
MDRRATLARIARALQAQSRWRDCGLPALWILTDGARTPDPIAAAADLPEGAGVVLRNYRDPDRANLARDLAKVAMRRRLSLVIGADAALARAVGAAGVHAPRWAPPIHPSADLWLTASAHSLADVARRPGVTAYFVSPVFTTASHQGASPLGPLLLAACARIAPVPIIALGGITAANAPRLLGTGAAGIAAIGALQAIRI